jgi:hypothetical protein
MTLRKLTQSRNVSVFADDDWIVDVASGMEAGQGLQSFVMSSFHGEPSGRLGEEESEKYKRDGGKSLEAEGETPLETCSHCALLAAITNPGGNEGTDTEEELECSGESTTVGWMSDFRLVERSQDSLKSVRLVSGITYHLTDPKTSDETTSHHHLLVHSCGLDNRADDEDKGRNGDWHEYL